MKIYLKGGKGIEKPVDFNGIEIKEGDILTFDCFDPFFSDKYYLQHHPKWSVEDIEKHRNKAMYRVKVNDKGIFYGEGLKHNLYLHDFRFKYTKIYKKSQTINSSK